MGAVCCRCHQTVTSFEEDLLLARLAASPLPAAAAITASAQRPSSSRRSMRRSAAIPAHMNATSADAAERDLQQYTPPPPPPPPRALSQSLANYIAFPFPFAKKYSVKQFSKSASSGSTSSKKKNHSGSFHARNASGKAKSTKQQQKKKPLPQALLIGFVGDYCRKTRHGTFIPLSLMESCIRTICMRLIHDPESALQPSCECDYEDDDDCMKQHAMVVPTELASAILVWLKRHHHLGKEQFRLLAPFLFYEWDLKDLVELDASWFDAIPRTPLQYLKTINVSGCYELESLGATQDAFSLPIEKLPSLTIANFQGCTKLSRSVLDVLQFSTKLISLNLSGCRKIDDQSLGAIQRLQYLESLDLSGCRLVTDAGLRRLVKLTNMRKLVLGCCLSLTDAGFKGIAMSYSHLRYLDVSHCRISNEALREIGRIRTLNTLILRGCNDISDDGMSSLSGLECLQYVDARHCEEIRSLPISWTDIRVLLLGRTSFGEADAAVLQYMPKLQELDLRSCRILKRGIEFISRLERLERLVLAETALTDAGLIEICKHNVYLKALDVSGTEVTDAGTMGLANLKDLEVLSLDTSGITNRSLANLTCLPQLEKLDLFGASITDNGLLHLVPLRRLKELEICSGTISDRGVELISKITTLTSLNLSQNRNIHAKSLVYIRSLTELRYLNLSNTSISALSLRHLYSLKELQSLSVYGCALTPSHIDVLRDILPELRYLRCD